MKKLLFTLFVLLLSLSFGQEIRLWDKTVSNIAATTEYSSVIVMDQDVRGWGKFDGLWGLALDVDSLAADSTSTPDSLLFFPQYLIAGVWVTGDTIQWYQVVRDSIGWADSTKWVIPRSTHHDWVMIWFTDPYANSIQKYPYDITRVMRVDNDSTNYIIDLRTNKY